MCSRIRKFALGTFLLIALSQFLVGCGNSGGADTSATKTVGGMVANSTTGLPISDATVTAYAIDATTGGVSSAPLSSPASTQSDSQGNYSLKLPKGYSGGVMVEATFPNLGSLVAKAGKTVARANSMQRIRAVLPSVQAEQVVLPPVMLSLATEMLVEYIENKSGATFRPADVQAAVLQLEPLLGANFTQVPPPAIGATPTVSQQKLLVVTQLVDGLLNLNAATPPTLAELVTVNPASGVLGLATVACLVTVDSTTGALSLGTVSNPANITTVTNSVASNLFNSGLIQGSVATTIGTNTSSAATTAIIVPDLTDTVAPTAPASMTVTATTYNSVTLVWAASTDNVGVVSYYVYRDGQFLGSTTDTTYSDAALAAATTYMYEVKARDAAGNISPAAMVNAKTAAVAAPASTHTVSGVITQNGAPLKGVLVTITGAGSGIAVTDDAGAYSLSGAPDGNYTITPSLQGYAFTPASKTLAVNGANVSGINFTATLTGSVTGSGSYPNGVVIGGISYPTGIVIGGISYPYATIIGGVTYPTGTVVGGVTYPNGVVIGGVQYPAGTVVGGVAFPSGSVMAGIIYPTGLVVAGIATPGGTLVGSAALASGSASAALDYYMVVTGRLMNSTGTAPLVGVNVVIVDQATSAQITVVTNFTGSYSFSGKIGSAYLVTPSTATYSFVTPSQNITVADGSTALVLPDFTAN